MKNQTRSTNGESLLRHCVETLAFGIGERSSHRLQALEASARFIEGQLAATGLTTERLTYVAKRRPYHLIIGELPGRDPSAGTYLVTAHSDAALIFPPTCDDVFSAAALLGLAAFVGGRQMDVTMRFVICVDLEWTDRNEVRVGNCLYAKTCRDRGDDLRLVLSINNLGAGVQPASAATSSSRPQALPLTFVGDLSSWSLARACARHFTRWTGLNAKWGAPSLLYPSLQTSDHLAFAQQRYQALAVTTSRAFLPGPSRPFHHVDYRALAAYVWGLETTLANWTTQTTG